MNTPKGITKYYIGFGVLMLVLVFAVTYVFSEAGAAKTDKQTDKTVEQISNKLESKIATTGEIPASLQAAGVSDPASTVTYTRLSTTKYKVCVEYKTASSGFDAGWGSLLLGGAFSSANQPSFNSDHTYFDSTVEFNHKKGQNCQTVTPYSVGGLYGGAYGGGLYNGSLAPSGSNLAAPITKVTCDESGNSVFVGYMTVKSINPALNDISFTSGDATTSPSSSSANSVTTRVYDSTTVFCDADAQPASVSILKAGDYVIVYSKSNSDSTIARIDVLE